MIYRLLTYKFFSEYTNKKIDINEKNINFDLMRFKALKIVKVYKYTKNIIEWRKCGLKCETKHIEELDSGRIGNGERETENWDR